MAQNADSKRAQRGRRRRGMDQRIMDLLGREWCGSSGPPTANRSIYVHDDGVTRVFSMQDDGGFVGVGYPDEWQVIMRTEAARVFALWTLWVWTCDWFGLRSALYHRALHHRVRGSWRFDYKRRGRWRKRLRLTSHDEWRERERSGAAS